MDWREIKVGMKVRVPEDRGDRSHIAEVINVGATEPAHSLAGEEYQWVLTRKLGSQINNIWPSNRLTKA